MTSEVRENVRMWKINEEIVQEGGGDQPCQKRLVGQVKMETET